MKTGSLLARIFVALATAASLHAHAAQGVNWINLTKGGVATASPLFVTAGDVLNFDVMLTANGTQGNPPGTSGLGVCLEYTHAVAGDPTTGNLFQTDLFADGAAQPTGGACNKGGAVDVSGTDYSVIKGWIHLGAGGWPNVQIPLKLFDAQFTVASTPAGLTRIGFGASSVATGESFIAPTPIVLCGKPTVNVARTADGSETGPTAATFSVTLSAAVPAICTATGVFPVTLTLGGSATVPGQAGADYSLSAPNFTLAGQTITLNVPADGATTAQTITVTPVDDTLAEGTETVTLQVGAGTGNYAIGANSLASANITDNDVSPITFLTASLPGGQVGAAYSQSISVTGGTPGYTFSFGGGTLPPNVTLSAGGLVSGTPTTAGTYDFSVVATDSTSVGNGGPKSSSKSYQIVVAKGTQTITFGTLVDRALYSAPLTVSATSSASLTVTFSVTGACTLSGGNTVTPNAIGVCTVRASQAGNANWNAAANVDRPFNVTAPTVSISPAATAGGTVGVAYSTTSLTASGALAPYSFTVTQGALPAGITLGTNGSFSGTPTTPGTFGFTVTATDSTAANAGGPFTATKVYSITVAAASLTLDVDGNSRYDALTDGVLVIRYLFGLTGAPLINSAIGQGATRTDAASITARLDQLRPSLDVDGDGRIDALTDGVLVLRYMFGLRGATLVAGAVGQGAARSTSTQIETYIASLVP